MSGPNGSVKASDTVSFTNVENPTQTSGVLQSGGWANLGTPPSPPYTGVPSVEILEGVSAQTKVSVSGVGVVQVGAPNQFKLQVSLSAGTVQLTAHVNTANNVNTDPALAPFIWVSRQRFIATVTNNGLVTLVGRGSTTIECRYPRSANLPFTNASPSGTEFAYATLDLTVTA